MKVIDSDPVEPARALDGQSVALIHDRVRTAILRGELAPGQEAPQAVLAKKMGVGRTPLREALRLLEREGLVVAEPNRRVRIAGFSAADVEEIYVTRIALESWAVRLTVPQLTNAELAELEGLIAQIDFFIRSDDRDGAWRAHSVFNAILVSAAGHRVRSTLAEARDHAERYWRANTAHTTHIPEEGAEYRAIVDAAAARDEGRAADCLVAHYAKACRIIVAALEPTYKPLRLESMVAMVMPTATGAPG